MKDIKIGKLVFSKKAILLIAFCLFLNGMLIGSMVAYKQHTNGGVNFMVLYVMMFLPYLFFYRAVKRNITEVK